MQRTKPRAEFECKELSAAPAPAWDRSRCIEKERVEPSPRFERSEVWRFYLVQPYLQKKSRPIPSRAARSCYELFRFSPQSSVFAAVMAALIKQAAGFGCNLESTSTAFRRIIHGRCTSSRNSSSPYSFTRLIPEHLEFPMRQQRTKRMSAPTPISFTPISRAGVGHPTSGYALLLPEGSRSKVNVRYQTSARQFKGFTLSRDSGEQADVHQAVHFGRVYKNLGHD